MAWLTGWNRRKSKVVNGTTVGAQIDYQMTLTVYKGIGIDTPTSIYLGANVRDDFGDVRFTSLDGTTILSYWIESLALGSSAIIWIKIPSIPASPSTTLVYIYYNNPIAISISNGDTTFLFFDDFSGTSIDSTKWNTAEMSGAWNTSGGTLNINVPGGSDDRFILSTATYKARNCAIKFSFKATGGRVYIQARVPSVAYCASYNWPNPGYLLSAYLINNTIRIVKYVSCSGTFLAESGQTINPNIWYTLEALLYEDQLKLNFNNGTNIISATDTTPILSTERFGIHAGSPLGSVTYNFDNFFVRNYTSVEPIFGASGLEELSCPISPKYSGDTVHLSATPRDGIGPYYVEFRKETTIIASYFGAPEDVEVIYDYVLTDADIVTATTGIIRFEVFISDLCPTGAQTCTQYCDITIGCVTPVCNFTVT